MLQSDLMCAQRRGGWRAGEGGITGFTFISFQFIYFFFFFFYLESLSRQFGSEPYLISLLPIWIQSLSPGEQQILKGGGGGSQERRGEESHRPSGRDFTLLGGLQRSRWGGARAEAVEDEDEEWKKEREKMKRRRDCMWAMKKKSDEYVQTWQKWEEERGDWLPEVHYVSSETERQKPFFYCDRDAIKVLERGTWVVKALSTCRVNVQFQKSEPSVRSHWGVYV